MMTAGLELALIAGVFVCFGTALWFAAKGPKKSADTATQKSDHPHVVPERNSELKEPNKQSARPSEPDDRQAVTAYITVHDTVAALDFYRRAFSARELPGRLTAPDGKVMHATFSIGNTVVMIADEYLDTDSPMYSPGPNTLGATTFKLNLLVEDAAAVVDQAVAAGARLDSPVAEQFHGHISGRVADPYGHLWIISTELEKLDAQELQRRFSALYQ